MSQFFVSGDERYWSFSFSISPSNEYLGPISFKMDLSDLLTVQGTLKSPLQHHSSKASIRWRSTFFIVQLSHPYMIDLWGLLFYHLKWKQMARSLDSFHLLMLTVPLSILHLFPAFFPFDFHRNSF